VGWFRAKNPVLRFAAVFGLLLGLFYAVINSASFGRTVYPPYVRLSAETASRVCNWFGQGTSAAEGAVLSPRFCLHIEWGCDAIEPSALFMAAVLAFPASFRRKVPGIVLGAIVLAALNLVRIVSLFLVGVYYPSSFQWMHLEVWQILFVLLAIALWAVWIQWAMRPRPAASHVPG
jgi:exosortase H (IPTLxxWG-CTERM-specific)